MFGYDHAARDGVNRLIEHVNLCGQETDITLSTIVALLIEKKVFTAEEWKRERIKQTSMRDQARARTNEEAEKIRSIVNQ